MSNMTTEIKSTIVQLLEKEIGMVHDVEEIQTEEHHLVSFDTAYKTLTYTECELIQRNGFFIHTVGITTIEHHGKRVRGLHIQLRKQGDYLGC